MSLRPGTRLGAYEVVAPLGAGGMGEVYKARDGRLDRIVAVKILPQHVASDPTLRQRFEREARALALLSHPHICAVYDVGQAETEQGAIHFMVMEHLEGDTLAARLTTGPLPTSEALSYAIQIADALDKAHRKGVIHRDLKPGNIMITDGGAKLLDFGLARMTPVAPSSEDMSAAPTVTSPLTGTGTIVGTFQYMAPEQLEGREADLRSDIFAFGAVLYEMLTGRKAFEGKSQASLIAAILEREPASVSAVQPTSPAALDQIVKTCLAKNPDHRWQSAGDIGRQLRWIVEGGAAHTTRRRPAWLVPAVVVAVAALLVALGVWALTRSAPSAPRPVSRLLLTPSAAAPLVSVAGTDVAISPDGTRIVYLGEVPQGGRALYVRDLGGLEPRLIAGTEVPRDFTNANPSFSSDGGSIVFRSAGKGILKAALGGGVPIKIADDEPGFVGAASGRSEVIMAVVRPGGANGLYRVPENGGAPERLTPAVAENVLYVAPTFLPGDKAVLYYLIGVGDQSERVAVFDLATRSQRILVEGGANPTYSPSGHLVFARGTTLMAVRFDADRMAVIGSPFPVVQEVRHPGLITAADYALSRDGTLIYVPAGFGTAGSGLAKVVWVERGGRSFGSAIDAPLKYPRDMRLSPDGRRLLITTALGDISVYDLSGRPALPLVSGSSGSNGMPLWSPDGQQVFFSARRNGLAGLYSIRADGSDLAPKSIPIANFASLGDYFPGASPISPLTWMRDGRLLIAAMRATGGADILALPAAGGTAEDVIKTDYIEDSGAVSPDGKWLAYRSNRSGRDEIWVRASDGSAPIRVSQNGGREPLWARNGSVLFYLERTKVMSLIVKPGEDFTFEPPTELFDGPYLHPSSFLESATDISSRTFDVVPDGRFLMFSAVEDTDATTTSGPAGIVVVQNWSEELKRLVPTP